MNLEQARRAVLALAEQIAAQLEDGGGAPRLSEAAPLEHPWGWAFSLSLPLDPAPPADPDAESGAEPDAEPRQMHVLVERANGRLTLVAPGRPLDEHLARFEAQAAGLLTLRRGPRGVSALALERELQVVFHCSPAEASALTQRCLRGESFQLRLGPGADIERSRLRLEGLGLEILPEATDG